ncbi:hypothetical protein [Adhaeribacter aquaticus]|uniref:hypothetical protein n=1 Tax=Adhaeribacter aquaticus TaxID=299567 RepID=UPI00040D48CA|nr:hypothetical protein [Adhaeribacter aquaticus]
MDIGSTLLNQDIALFTREEAEEALVLVRYFLNKEKSYEQKAVYLEFLDKLENYLTTIYIEEIDRKISGFGENFPFDGITSN